MTRLSPSMCEFLNISDPERRLSRSEFYRMFYSKCKEIGIIPTKHLFPHSEVLNHLLNIPIDEELSLLNLNTYLLPHMIDLR